MPLSCDEIATYRNRHQPTESSDPLLIHRLTKHLMWHRWMSTPPRHFNICYHSVLCIISTLAYRLYSFWSLINTFLKNSQQLFLHIIARFYQKKILPRNFHSRITKEKAYIFLFPSCSYFLFPHSFLPVFLLCMQEIHTPVPSAISHLPVCATV